MHVKAGSIIPQLDQKTHPATIAQSNVALLIAKPRNLMRCRSFNAREADLLLEDYFIDFPILARLTSDNPL